MKNSNDTIGDRTRDLPVCSAVPQPTALPRAPFYLKYMFHWHTDNKLLLYIILLHIFINCHWVVTRWQYTFTHKQYTEQQKYCVLMPRASRLQSFHQFGVSRVLFHAVKIT